MKGLRTKYILQKRIPCSCGADKYCKDCEGRGFTTEDVDPNAEYFVLRLDEDSVHGRASRVALSAYSEMVYDSDVDLANDLREMVHANTRDPEQAIFFWNAGKSAKNDFTRQLEHWMRVIARTTEDA